MVPTPKVKVPWLCSRSQPGIKVIIRDIRGHLLHTVTFLVLFIYLLTDNVFPFFFFVVVVFFSMKSELKENQS